MKKYILVIIALFSFSVYGQQTINDTIIHDGLKRSYILFVPASYNPGNPAPLVFNFHGYGSDAFQQMFYGNFLAISETGGFIVAHPNGTLDSVGERHWNANWGTGVDDIGFTSALIDTIASQYNINLKRVYSTGMSNGGFMSYTLACALSDRIAAVASVTGSMVVTQIPVCNPQPPVPVMEIHGTADGTVPFNGIPGMVEPIDVVLDYWVNINQCDTIPIVTQVPDINILDGCTAEHYLYKNGMNGAEVELYKIIGGGHTWPGSQIPIGVTNQDINASEKIWEFFNKYDIDGRITNTIIEADISTPDVNIYPNPTEDYVILDFSCDFSGTVTLLFPTGKEVKIIKVKNSNYIFIPLEGLSKGIYFSRIFDEQNRQLTTKKIIKM